MTTLYSLPFDILLVVFRELDVVGSVRLGMTCKGLSQIAQDRQVWVDQLERLFQEDPILKPATPPLTSLSTQELKTFATSRAKFRLCFNNGINDFVFAAERPIRVPMVQNLLLLPGGKSVLAMGCAGTVTLCRIGLEGGQASLSVMAKIGFGRKRPSGALGPSKLITTTSPCPIFVYDHDNGESSTKVVKVDHHNNTMSLETTLRLPWGCCFVSTADGQGRVICFFVQPPAEFIRVAIIHLDRPGIVVVSDVLPTDDPEPGPGGPYNPWYLCMPTENLVIIYSPKIVLACKIPGFSDLPPGTHTASVTPMWLWRGLDRSYKTSRIRDPELINETVYDQHSTREFSLYSVDEGVVITATVPIDASDPYDRDSTQNPDELPALKQKSTTVGSQATDTNTVCCRKGLYFDEIPTNDGVCYVVIPLKNVAANGPGNVLRLVVSRKEFKHVALGVCLDMDEATGRVIVWGPRESTEGISILIGDLA